MKQQLKTTVLLAAMAAFAIAADVTGTWTATFDTQVGAQAYTYVFKQDGTKTRLSSSAIWPA